jgi:hypothetical protein
MLTFLKKVDIRKSRLLEVARKVVELEFRTSTEMLAKEKIYLFRTLELGYFGFEVIGIFIGF